MVGADLHSIFSGFLKLALLAGAALYAGLVLMSYLTDGPHLRPRVDWRDPAHSAERLAVWLGVKALTLAVRVANPDFRDALRSIGGSGRVVPEPPPPRIALKTGARS